MADDARFEDSSEKPLRLKAEDAGDLPAISAMLQDAVLPLSEMSWQPTQRRFGMLANRFRWEDVEGAARQKRDFERVQSVLAVESVLKVRSSGIDVADKTKVICLLSVQFVAHGDGGGEVQLILAGDGAIALDVECIDMTLTDVTRPYVAPSRKKPTHPI
jgi:hypothetical protein